MRLMLVHQQPFQQYGEKKIRKTIEFFSVQTIGRLTKLEVLYLDYNRQYLTGTIPTGKLKKKKKKKVLY